MNFGAAYASLCLMDLFGNGSLIRLRKLVEIVVNSSEKHTINLF